MSVARIQIMGIAPIVHAWAAAGHQSLAEITAEQVRAALPDSGSRRNFAEYGLRSLFTVLKSRKLIFTNPTRGMRATPVNATVPLPLDAEAIRRALNSADPAVALAVALVAFHALTSRQLRSLTLTDIIDGRLTLDGRDIPLASPVRVRLTAWLDHRGRTWPGRINEHLFVSRKTAPRLVPVGSQFPWKRTDLRPQALREDRIFQEIHASGGDARRICDLFGLTVQAALRYALTLGHPDLERTHIPWTAARLTASANARSSAVCSTAPRGRVSADSASEPSRTRRRVQGPAVIGRQTCQLGLRGLQRGHAVGMVHGQREPGHVHAHPRAGQVDAHRDVRPWRQQLAAGGEARKRVGVLQVCDRACEDVVRGAAGHPCVPPGVSG